MRAIRLLLIVASALSTACTPPETTKRVSVGGTKATAVEATWLRAMIAVPTDPALDPTDYVVGMMFHEPIQSALASLEERGFKSPVIVFLHGCNGVMDGFFTLGERYAKRGYITIAPDSFARPGRRPRCGKPTPPGTFQRRWREEELRYARDQLARQGWAKQSHIYLVGFSEGGGATARTTSPDFRARIVLGATCTEPVKAPRTQPTLALVSKNDLTIQTLVGRGEKCKVNRHPLSESRYIKGYQHDITAHPQVLRRIDRFLAQTR